VLPRAVVTAWSGQDDGVLVGRLARALANDDGVAEFPAFRVRRDVIIEGPTPEGVLHRARYRGKFPGELTLSQGITRGA